MRDFPSISFVWGMDPMALMYNIKPEGSPRLERYRTGQSSSFSSKLYPEPLETQAGEDFTLQNKVLT